MNCEMCGRREAAYAVRVEGAKLEVCVPCSRHGKVLYPLQDTPAPVRVTGTSPARAEEEIVEDYAKRIRNAREKAGLSRTELAQKLSEKENYLEAIEQGRILPALPMAKKLEKELGITLIETETAGGAPESLGPKGSAVTLGDLLAAKKKK